MFRKKQAPIDEANPIALRMAKTAFIALLLLLNCDKVRITYVHNPIRHALLETHERLRTATLRMRFIAATLVNTTQGWSVIVAGLGTLSRGWPGLFWAFPNIITAVKIKENDTIIMRIASTRI